MERITNKLVKLLLVFVVYLSYQTLTSADNEEEQNSELNLRLTTESILSPQTVGIVVPLVGTVDQNSETLEYKFLIQAEDEQQYTVLRDWSDDNRFEWNTLGCSDSEYTIELQIRNIAIDTEVIASRSMPYRLSSLAFDDVTSVTGIESTGESWGGAFGDVNADGLPDIWMTNHRRTPSLYVNNGDGTFIDATDTLLVTKNRTDSHGTAWADFDNDGDQDLVQSAGGGQGIRQTLTGHETYLYTNERGYLTNEGVIRGVSYPEGRGRGVTWLDWNQDGNLDLFIACQTISDSFGNALFTQQDGGVFTYQNEEIGILGSDSGQAAIVTNNLTLEDSKLFVFHWMFPRLIYPGNHLSDGTNIEYRYNHVTDANAGDYNGDGINDFFISRRVHDRQYYRLYSDGSLGFIFGTFNKSVDNGISFTAEGDVVIDLAVPGQRDSGVYIGSNGISPREFDYTPINGNEQFSITLSPDDPRVTGLRDRSITPYGVYIGYDEILNQWTLVTYNTTDMAPYSTVFGLIHSNNISNIEEVNFETKQPHPRDVLLLGNRNGELIESEIMLPDGTLSKSIISGDFDNDMDIDIYVLQSSRIYNMDNFIYLNTGGGNFQVLEASDELANGTTSGTGDTVLMADFDVDGFLDIVLFNGEGEPPFNKGDVQVYKNRGNENNWIEIDLEGVVSNRDGIGAVVFVTTPDEVIQVREQNGGIHNKGQNHKRLHFGLGNNDILDISVLWPSGIRQELKKVDVNQVLRIKERHYTILGDSIKVMLENITSSSLFINK